MPHEQKHRGPHPDDPELFTEATRLVLLRACDEAAFLLDRGYGSDSVLDVVARRHLLRVRQRTALQRCMCSSEQARLRQNRLVYPSELTGGCLEIDGFNLIIGAEVGLSRGLLLRGRDGAYRDLAGLRGSYHLVSETEQTLEICGKVFRNLNLSKVNFYLDEPVSNSGRLRQLILAHAVHWTASVNVELVPNPDRILCEKACVVSSDSLVLDRAHSWVNLLGLFVTQEFLNPWILDLSEPSISQPSSFEI